MGITLFYGLSSVAGLVGFVCFIIVLVKMFQRAGVGMGIVGIITCGIATFIWGWIKAKELALTKVMAIWTVCWLVSVGTGMVAGGMMAKSIAENPEFQKAMQDAQQRAQQQQTAPAPAPAPSN